MPTVTELSQHPIINVGPLTTAFTAPASCATASPHLHLALHSAYPDRVSPFYSQKCEYAEHGDCFPSGKALDDAYSSDLSTGFNSAATIHYFSPASVCPDAYTTVGVAAKNSDGDISSSGLFVPPVVTVAISAGQILGSNPMVNVLMEALDPNETAIICCPRDYTMGIHGGCWSEVPETVYGEKTVCMRKMNTDNWTYVDATFTYNNTVISGSVMSYTATRQDFTTRTQTLTGNLAGTWVPVASRPAITMVHNAAQTADASSSGTAAPSGTAPSAAHGSRMTTSRGSVGVLVTVWTFAALAGVALAMPF